VRGEALIRIRVPASTSNLGAGFDALGLALGLYLTLEIEGTAEPFGSFVFEGEGADELRNASHENLIFQTMRLIASREDVELKPARVKVNNEIPLARGLGSSGAAIIAGISAFEALSGVSLTTEKILGYAAEIEGHSDNVSAALLGGFVISCMTGDGTVLAGKIDWPSRIRAVAVIPDFMLRTHDARAVIPETVPHRDAVFNLQRSSLMVAAIASGQTHLIREAMKDRLHQPYRAGLAPGLSDVLDAMADGDESLESIDGFLGLALSGSGPTVLALATGDYHEIASEISSRFERYEIPCRSDILSIEQQGRGIEEIE
jgi:homoserine kinase